MFSLLLIHFRKLTYLPSRQIISYLGHQQRVAVPPKGVRHDGSVALEEMLATQKCVLVIQRSQIAGDEPALSGDGVNV